MTKLKLHCCPQVTRYCSPQESTCWKNITKEMFSCNISCTGLYADVQHVSEESTEAKHDQISKVIQKSYSNYKNSFAKNIEFYQDISQVSGFIEFPYENAYLKEYPKLIFVDIFFDTATYDEIKRDKKVTYHIRLKLLHMLS